MSRVAVTWTGAGGVTLMFGLPRLVGELGRSIGAWSIGLVSTLVGAFCLLMALRALLFSRHRFLGATTAPFVLVATLAPIGALAWAKWHPRPEPSLDVIPEWLPAAIAVGGQCLIHTMGIVNRGPPTSLSGWRAALVVDNELHEMRVMNDRDTVELRLADGYIERYAPEEQIVERTLGSIPTGATVMGWIRLCRTTDAQFFDTTVVPLPGTPPPMTARSFIVGFRDAQGGSYAITTAGGGPAPPTAQPPGVTIRRMPLP